VSAHPKRFGVAAGDVLLVLAGLGLLAALAYPRVERRLMRRHADEARAHVEAVGAAVAAFRKEHSDWPPSGELGEVPPDLAAHLPRGFSFRAGAFALKCDRWEAVEPLPEAEAEPTYEEVLGPAPAELPLSGAPDSTLVLRPPVVAFGAITVQAEDDRILAALLERFGPTRSFVRDGAWTLVLPPEGGSGERIP
jgi:hypothetical protein